MIDAPIMQNTDAPTCQPQSAVGSFYRRMPNPRIVAATHVFADTKVDKDLYNPDLLWDGSTWHLYYETTHDVTAGVIRHASSADLATWTFDDTPAITGTQSQPSVAKLPDGRFLMLYIDALGSGAINASISSDPKAFPAGTVALSKTDVYPGVPQAVIEDPELVVVGSTFHLWFSSRDCATRPCTKQGIGHATSTNGTTWTLESPSVPSLLRASSDPASGGLAPAVIYDDAHCKFEMWLENDASTDTIGSIADSVAGVWHATSTNGTSWTINYSQLRDLPWDSTAAGEHLGMSRGADVAIKAGGRYMLYPGFDNVSVPSGSKCNGTASCVMTLNLATRDAP